MALQDLTFGGLRLQEFDERVPVEAALDATNLYVDKGGIEGRNGYTAATAASVGSGTPQGLWRFRPNGTGPSTARTVVVRGGSVIAVSDPSHETTTDGTATTAGSGTFGTTANISAAQLGQYLYLGTDESTNAWRRMKPDFTLESFSQLPQGAITSISPSILSYTEFHTLAHTLVTVAGSALTVSTTGFENWLNVSGPGGNSVYYDIGSAVDWSSNKWLFVACSPETLSGGANTFTISVSADNSGTPAGFQTLQTITDNPGTNGSPWGVYLSLQSLPAATRQGVRYIQFTQGTVNQDPFSIHGFMAASTAPSSGEVAYYITFFNSVTEQESVLSAEFDVVYGSTTVAFPSVRAVHWNYNNLQDLGVRSTAPDSMGISDMFNRSGGISYPTNSDFASIFTFSGSIPTGAQFPNADTVRLWRQTDTGIRLVKCSVAPTQANGTAWTTSPTTVGGVTTPATFPVGATYWTNSGTQWSIMDDTGDATLANQSYKAGGPPPSCMALAALAGRLICGGDPANPQRVSISSYNPFAANVAGGAVDPFPQFPQIALEEADGWSFDIAPTGSEQVLWIGAGDLAAYILTNEACYVMTDLSSNGRPYKVYERGVLGRRGACWAEAMLFWCAHDGIYAAENRSRVQELTAPIRRIFREWFLPDSTVTMGYQDRKLYAVVTSTRNLIVSGVTQTETLNRMLRFDFVTETWTRHTLAHQMLHTDDWRDPTGTLQQLWFLDASGNLWRWQPGLSVPPGSAVQDPGRATTDGGTAIQDWTYSTGFGLREVYEYGKGYMDVKTRIRSTFLDTTGDVTATYYKDFTTSPARSRSFAVGEHQLPFAPDVSAYKWRLTLTGANGVAVRRALWDREVVEGEGA